METDIPVLLTSNTCHEQDSDFVRTKTHPSLTSPGA